MKFWGFDPGGLLNPVDQDVAIRRTEAEQQAAQRAADQLALYYTRTCGYCLRVRRAIERLAIHIRLLDTTGDPDARRELIEGGGRATVPCLRIDEDDGRRRWLYESADIVEYLEQRFGASAG